MIKNPVFIIGNPRSGTSLLRVILNSHPDLLIPPECGFAVWLYPAFKNKDISKKEVIVDYVNALKTTRKFETWNIDTKELIYYLLKVAPRSYAELIDQIHQFYGITQNIQFKRWGDKNNFYLDKIKEINEIFPHAQFIHIVRDGRDVASSYIALLSKQINSKYSPNLPGNIEDIANEWQENNIKIEQSLSKIDDSHKVIVRHEDVILKFKDTLNLLTNFLGIPYSHKMEEFQFSEKAVEPEEFMQWKSKLYGKLDQSSIERYTEDLSIGQIETFNNIAMVSLAKYGYKI